MLVLVDEEKHQVIGFIKKRIWNSAPYAVCTKLVRMQSGVIYSIDDIQYISLGELAIKDFRQNLIFYKATNAIIDRVAWYNRG